MPALGSWCSSPASPGVAEATVLPAALGTEGGRQWWLNDKCHWWCYSLFHLHFLVKPLPPSSIKAEITRNDGLLNVSWTNPVFTNDDLKFQIRYAVNREELTWEVLSFSIQSEAWIVAVLSCSLSASRYWWSWLYAMNQSSEYLHYLAQECYWIGLSLLLDLFSRVLIVTGAETTLCSYSQYFDFSSQ